MCSFDMQTTLFIKAILNERVEMLNSGHAITPEEIENLNEVEEFDLSEDHTEEESTEKVI